MKKCSKCKEEKDNSNFGKDKRLKSGLRGECKKCHKKVCDNWRERNPDKVKVHLNTYYTNNKEARLKAQKLRDENLSPDQKERKKEKHREYYLTRRETYLESQRDKRRNRTLDEKAKEYLKDKEYYEKNKESIKAKARERTKNLTQGQKQQNVIRNKEWRQRNREKTKAWSAVGNALFSGELDKPPYCELCGVFDVKIHAHHENYSKPLEVLWLCHDCHMSLHAEERLKKAKLKHKGVLNGAIKNI